MTTKIKEKEEGQKVVSILQEVVGLLKTVDFSGMSQEEAGRLMYEAKVLAKGLNGIYDAGRATFIETVKANGNVLVAGSVTYKIELGSARVSAKKFDELLIAEGIAPVRVKELKDEAKGNRPEQFYVEVDGQRA